MVVAAGVMMFILKISYSLVMERTDQLEIRLGGGTIDIFSFTSAPGGAALYDNMDLCINGGIGTNSTNFDPDGNGGPILAAGLELTSTTLLPIRLKYFRAQRFNENSAKLQWATTTEINASHFIIERSSDTRSWEVIGSVDASGESAAELQYDYIDKNVFNGRRASARYFYRIIMVDRDGWTDLSHIEAVRFSTDGIFAETSVDIFPNPATDGINVMFNYSGDTAPAREISIFDNLGKLVYRGDVGEKSDFEYIDFSSININSGAYIVQILDTETQILDQQKIIVSR